MAYLSIEEKTETVDGKERRTTKIAIDETELAKFNTCIFLSGLDPVRHKDWVAELDTDYVANNDNYPKSMRDALKQAVDREDKIKRANKANHKKKPVQQTAGDRVEGSFAQGSTNNTEDTPKSILKKNKKYSKGNPYYHLYCDVCGGQGHPSDQCANICSDSEGEYEPEDCVGFGG
jgi:hypothetical protein